MNYEKVNPRKYSYEFAESGVCSSDDLKRANRLVKLAHKVGIEPWGVSPGSRQCRIECYDSINKLQVSLFAESIEHDKVLSSKVSKVFSSGLRIIYINYNEDTPKFKIGDVIESLDDGHRLEIIDIKSSEYEVICDDCDEPTTLGFKFESDYELVKRPNKL